VVIESDGERITGVAGDADHPSSRGKLCTKGSTLHLTMAPPAMAGRARYPERRETRDARRERTTWDDALGYVAQRFAETIARHGPDSVAFYISGQLLTEDYYVFNKLAKGLIGTANVDTNSRLCMSSAVTGYTKTLGADAPPSCYEDIDHAGCLFIAGSIFFSLSFLLSTVFSDLWRPLLIALCAAFALRLFEEAFHDFLPSGIFSQRMDGPSSKRDSARQRRSVFVVRTVLSALPGRAAASSQRFTICLKRVAEFRRSSVVSRSLAITEAIV